MTNILPPLDALYLDHSAGALDPAATLVMNVQLRLRGDLGGACSLADILGGALLERIEPVALGASPLPRGEAAVGEDALDPEARAISLIDVAQSDPKALAWRWRWFGVQDHALPVPGARLLRMKAGATAPWHSHKAHELTLVLSGRYVDEEGAYGPGDLAVAGPGHVHRPHTLRNTGCLCLTAVVGEGAMAAVRRRLTAVVPAGVH